MIADALKLSVYFGESVAAGPLLASEVLMRRLDAGAASRAALLRGTEGFGINRRIHAERFPDVSTDLPLLAHVVDTRERIVAALDDVDRAVPRGLVRSSTRASRPARTSPAPSSRAGRGGREAHDLLRLRRARTAGAGLPRGRGRAAPHGATGAIVLAGRRRPARRPAPASAPVRRTARADGDHLGRPAGAAARPLPHLAELLARRSSRSSGSRRSSTTASCSSRLRDRAAAARRLADDPDLHATHGAGPRAPALQRAHAPAARGRAAGATTILGDWGFSSDEPPHGDKLGRVASHRPTYTVCIDRPERIAELWPIIDELTAEHGIVTSLFVPGYRERAGGHRPRQPAGLMVDSAVAGWRGAGVARWRCVLAGPALVHGTHRRDAAEVLAVRAPPDVLGGRAPARRPTLTAHIAANVHARTGGRRLRRCRQILRSTSCAGTTDRHARRCRHDPGEPRPRRRRASGPTPRAPFL